MSTDQQPPFHWTPISTPAPLAPATPRRRPARGDLPIAPHPLHTLPSRGTPTPDPVPEPAAPSSPAAPVPSPAPPAPPADAPVAPGGGTSLTASLAARHGISLHKPGTLQVLLDVDGGELAALVDTGALLEIALGAGLVRYAFAAEVPAAATATAERGAA